MTIVELLETSQAFLIIASLVLGLLVGSFLNVIIYRMPVILQRDWKRQCSEFLEIDNSLSKDKSHFV